MAHRIIAIDRQSGSGGAFIGARVAEELGIVCYNEQLIDMALELGGLEHALHADQFRRGDERRPNLAFYRLYDEGNENVTPALPAEDTVFELQKKLITDISHQEDAVIVGRGSGWILKDDEDVRLLNVYIVGSFESRVTRAMQNSKMTLAQAKRYVRKVDKQRGDFYYYITKQNWDDYTNYHLVLNSEKLGIEKCVDLLREFYNEAL
ncbi:MAG: cytidylate kinase-like family protein [Eubacterium sp.]|nr:cytidylate kinase-like family protein [Eubacterium sp.]